MGGSFNANHFQFLLLGAAWTIGTRWSVRALGFGNTMVMARLLIPSDYGLVAIGMLLYGVLQAFIENGAAVALLRKDAVTEQEINAVQKSKRKTIKIDFIPDD